MKKIILLLLSVMLLCSCGVDKTESGEVLPKKTTSGRVGDTLEYGNIKLTLESVEKYVDNSEFKLDVAEEGKEFILLRFVAENTGDEDDHINMFYEEAYCDDVAIDSEALLFSADGDALWGDVAAGKMRKGYVAYELDENWSKLEFAYQHDMFSDDSKLTFEVLKEDIK